MAAWPGIYKDKLYSEWEFILLVISRIVAPMTGSLFIRSSTFRIELRTVEWFLSSYCSPISFNDRFVRLLIRYIDT